MALQPFVCDESVLDALCEALHRNDPHCTEAAVIWDRERVYEQCPPGYGPRLGQALCGNEFVQTIELQLGHFPRSYHGPHQ
jgi:hypothetical protein